MAGCVPIRDGRVWPVVQHYLTNKITGNLLDGLEVVLKALLVQLTLIWTGFQVGMYCHVGGEQGAVLGLLTVATGHFAVSAVPSRIPIPS